MSRINGNFRFRFRFKPLRFVVSGTAGIGKSFVLQIIDDLIALDDI